MIFNETGIPQAFVVDLERIEDERGSFARIWCCDELAAHGLTSSLAQSSLSFNHRAGSCAACISRPHRMPRPSSSAARGARSSTSSSISVPALPHTWSTAAWSWTRRKGTHSSSRRAAARLSDARRRHRGALLHLPSLRAERLVGVRFDDPVFGIEWPVAPQRVISPRDLTWPDYVRIGG